jgi:hypothetical protein
MSALPLPWSSHALVSPEPGECSEPGEGGASACGSPLGGVGVAGHFRFSFWLRHHKDDEERRVKCARQINLIYGKKGA